MFLTINLGKGKAGLLNQLEREGECQEISSSNIRCRKLSRFGHVCRQIALPKIILLETVGVVVVAEVVRVTQEAVTTRCGQPIPCCTCYAMQTTDADKQQHLRGVCENPPTTAGCHWSFTINVFGYDRRKHIKQEKFTNCGTSAADMLANFLAGQL